MPPVGELMDLGQVQMIELEWELQLVKITVVVAKDCRYYQCACDSLESSGTPCQGD